MIAALSAVGSVEPEKTWLRNRVTQGLPAALKACWKFFATGFDNGNGIDAADYQKLFQPYFSTKGRGTGLGLPIVHRIVTDHNGKIKAVSNQPNGAKFIVELPVQG